VASDVGVCALQRVVATPPRGGESEGRGRSTRTGMCWRRGSGVTSRVPSTSAWAQFVDRALLCQVAV